jgi:phage shock protein E
MNSSLYKIGILIAGILFGAIAGYLYYRFVGCASGQCAITSNPIISTLYGALLGGLLAHNFQK